MSEARAVTLALALPLTIACAVAPSACKRTTPSVSDAGARQDLARSTPASAAASASARESVGAPAIARGALGDAAPGDARGAPRDGGADGGGDGGVGNGEAAFRGRDGGAAACRAVEPRQPLAPARIAERALVRAAGYEYTMDRAGAVSRAPTGGAPRVVAYCRAGTRFAAAPIGDGHAVMACLADRKTTEGVQSQAFVVLDDGAPLRLSEEGSGATFVELAQRGKDVVAVLIDARMAMTPVHARILTLDGAKLVIGGDAVIFVGGTPERRTAAAIATSPRRTSFALLAMASEGANFGMASIRIDDPPKDDAPVTWSLYPNGLDPAPIAATHGSDTMYFARVRPELAPPGSPRVLELGRVADDGAITLLGTYAVAGALRNVGVDLDAKGVVTLTYSDDEGSWTQRLACP